MACNPRDLRIDQSLNQGRDAGCHRFSALGPPERFGERIASHFEDDGFAPHRRQFGAQLLRNLHAHSVSRLQLEFISFLRIVGKTDIRPTFPREMDDWPRTPIPARLPEEPHDILQVPQRHLVFRRIENHPVTADGDLSAHAIDFKRDGKRDASAKHGDL